MVALVFASRKSPRFIGMKKTQRTQKGGRFVGKGAYGCSFTPAPSCASGKKYTSSGSPTLGKIVYDDVGDEYDISKIVMGLSDASTFFAAPTRSCVPALPIDDPEAAKCVLKHMKGTATPTMLIMPYAGDPLVSWSTNLVVLAQNLLPMMRHLLKGIQLYQGADIVHNDIHMGNIVVDKARVARFIDFGLAFRKSKVRGFEEAHHNRDFSPHLIWHPPEVQAMRIALGGLRMEESVAKMKDENHDLVTIGSQFNERLSGSLLAAMTRFVRDHGSLSYGAFVRQYGFAFDCWRIGLCFWYMWNDLVEWSGLQFMPVWAHRDVIRAVISGLTDFDPRSRFTVEGALARLD
jgi:hypothetical protein